MLRSSVQRASRNVNRLAQPAANYSTPLRLHQQVPQSAAASPRDLQAGGSCGQVQSPNMVACHAAVTQPETFWALTQPEALKTTFSPQLPATRYSYPKPAVPHAPPTAAASPKGVAPCEVWRSRR